MSKTIDVQFYHEVEIVTVIISNIKYIEELEMSDGFFANLHFIDNTVQLLNINREKVKDLINRT